LSEAPKPDWCFASQWDAHKALQGGGSRPDLDKKPRPEVDKLELQFVFQRDGKAVALGHTSPGTKVPTAVRFDPTSKRVIWQQATPSVSKATLRDSDKFGAISGDMFVTTYGAGRDD